MYTLGYSFRPWKEAKSIADGSSILDYVRETAADHDVDRNIRFGHRVVRAEWSSADARWTVHAEREDTLETAELTCGFLFMCTGYYRYDEGHTPQFAGSEDFRGQIVHPQHWRRGRRPRRQARGGDRQRRHRGDAGARAGRERRARDHAPALAELRRLAARRGPDRQRSCAACFLSRAAYSVVRWKNVLHRDARLSAQPPPAAPGQAARAQGRIERRLPAGYDVDTHFSPSYNPWDQRMCLVPDSDLFAALSSGRASIVTEHIDTFTADGLRLRSGEELDADIVVTATGLNLLALGGMQVAVDGQDVDVSQTMAYKGMMLSGVPNLALSFGYTNASWTLKADLTCGYVCRLLNYMDEHGYAYCTPVNDDPSLTAEPFLDFSSGYVQRSIHMFPKQGSRVPWRVHQNYARDMLSLRRAQLDDGELHFSRAAPTPAPSEPLATAGA